MPDVATNQYPYPVSHLLTLGDPRERREWPVYATLGLTGEHVPDLIRMVLDDLNEADSESREVWAPLHAWRALGQLRAVDAVEPLLGLLRRIDERDDDWVGEELPRVFSMIGAPAIPALTAYLADAAHGLFARIAAEQIDLSVMGDWEDAQIKLGLKTERAYPPQRRPRNAQLGRKQPALASTAGRRPRRGIQTARRFDRGRQSLAHRLRADRAQ